MAGYDILIQGGKVIDGSGGPWRLLDVAVKDGRIVELKKNLPSSSAQKTIKADGMYVSPGFIDAHSHADIALLADKWMVYRIMQGITTEVVGQDGLSYAPCSDHHLDQWRRYLTGLNGDFSDRVSWNWNSTESLLDQYTNIPSNAVHLTPHGAVRVEVMGWEERPAEPGELEQMQDLVRKSLEEGAAGISTGLTYIPCSHATTEEMIALCEPVGEMGGILSIHLRSYADQLLEAVDESVRMGRESGAAIHISHLRMADQSTWHLAEAVLESIEKARASGVDVTFDIYPYTVGCAPLFCLIPPWAQAGGPDQVLERLINGKSRARIRNELQTWALDWSNYTLSNAPHPLFQSVEGKPVTEAAEMLEIDTFQLIMDVLVETQLDATITAGGGDEEANQIMIKHPLGMIGSDGVLVGKYPHPRGYGTYPKLLTKYVRDEPVLRLEEAIRKMTSFPANRHHLLDRGLLSPGKAADIVVFSLEKMHDRATYKDARKTAEGVHTVLINGDLVVKNGNYLGSTSGMALRPFQNRSRT